MRALDNDALLCDFAQFYHIYDFNDFSVQYLAILGCGLPEDARIIKKLSKQNVTRTEALLALIADNTTLRVWQESKDGHKNKNRPKSILNALMEKKESDEYRTFRNAAEFEAEYKRLTGALNGK